MTYVLVHPETGRDMVALHGIEDVKRYLNPKKPSAVKVLETKVHDGNGQSFKIRKV